jgi:plastocyanin
MKKFTVYAFAAFSGISFFAADSVHAQKWADLTMTVLLDGQAPEPKVLEMKADPKCGTDKQYSDDLVVDPKTKAIANIVFMIDTKKTKLEPSQIHPDLKNVPSTKPILDNVKCKFSPHLLAVRAGQTITVKNSDDASHNAKFSFFENTEVNPMIQSGSSKDVETTKEEKAPTKVDCNIHPWMNAYVIVTNHPYVGISGTDGKIKIEKLPAGVEIDFKLWHESQDKSIEEVSIGGKKETWKKGSVKLTLKEGANDLGTLLIKPDRFKSK